MKSRIRIRPVSRIQLKQDTQIHQSLQTRLEKRSFEDDLNKSKAKEDQPLKKKKISLQEYKLRRGVGSNNSSETVRSEATFTDMSNRLPGKVVDGIHNSVDQIDDKEKFFDPIKEAGYRTLMKLKQQKAAANRRKEEAIIKSRLRNVENVQFQPLMTDSETMKVSGITQPETLPQLLTSR